MIEPSCFAALEQMVRSQVGVIPFMYYPAFFALSGAVHGLSVEGAMNGPRRIFFHLWNKI
jgi:hypothetical protein